MKRAGSTSWSMNEAEQRTNVIISKKAKTLAVDWGCLI